MKTQDNWQTPDYILNTVRGFFDGGIDTDPCTSVHANLRVQAGTAFTAEDDGLQQCWAGNVFVNPPSGLVKEFFAEAQAQAADAVPEGIVFLAFNIEAVRTLQPLAGVRAVCFPRRRIAFIDPDNATRQSPRNASAIFYLPGKSDRTNSFADIFVDLGLVVHL